MKRCAALLGLAILLTGAAGPHKVTRTSPTLEFTYEWPAEAVAIPELDLKLYTDAKAKLAKYEKYAADGRADATRQKRDFNQYYYAAGWEVAGETMRLLSIEGGADEYSGGAHPNKNYWALLWDRRLNRQLSVDALFSHAGDFAALTHGTYCKLLNAERLKRRNGEPLSGLGTDDPFNQCPKYADLAIAPADKDKDGRFDRIDFVASPYTAGPYVEGEYAIEVPMTPNLIAAMKPEYRASFEAQRQ
jgi:hypothetical protein